MIHKFPLFTGIVVLSASLFFVACTTSTAFTGVSYHTSGDSSYTLKKSCIRDASTADRKNTSAVRLSLKSGDCTHKFKTFMLSHQGEMIASYFQGEELSDPARIVSAISPSFIQPVRSENQRDRIIKFYGR